VKWFGTATDIDKLKRAESALAEADRRKDEFIATLAHELRNPLAPIRNAVQLLNAKGPKAPDPTWTRDVIERQVAQMARLLDDLLDISRISRNRVELQIARVSLNAVLDLAVETSRPLIERAQHTLRVNVPERELWLNADAVRLAQVFSNLLNNAAKYTEPGGTIELAAEERGTELLVKVTDTGIGIAADMLPRVFDMFAQAVPALERSQGGLGIGLALARGLVDAMGGRIEVHSAGVGRGSEFRVWLPLLTAATRSDGDSERVARSASARRSTRLLIADDLVESADSLAVVLQLEGHDVHTAYDGEEALRKAEALRPELILLDIGMPKLNGYEVCERIRRLPWGSSVRLIALTGWGQEDARQRMQAAGFDDWLLKPVAGDVLLAAIEAASAMRPADGSLGAAVGE
jgi:CheY-like chemotaxis protein/nitrogen-specific signal transduction histidine kinase